MVTETTQLVFLHYVNWQILFCLFEYELCSYLFAQRMVPGQNCFIFRVELLGDSQMCRSRLSEQVLITRGVKDKDT